MQEIAIGLISLLLSTSSPVARQLAADAPARLAAVDAAYHQLLEKDQDTLDEVNDWISRNEALQQQGGGIGRDALIAKVSLRLTEMQKEYLAFLDKYPNHVDARIAYGSFLNEINQEELAAEEWEKARQLDPTQPAAWNNLANHYGHFGPVTNAFAYYARAIELTPDEPVYHQNLATTVYLFRRDAEQYYGIDEQQVFDKALALYRRALKLSNGSFPVANDLAQTYYGITPFRYEEALNTWKEVLKLATTDLEQQNVFIHLARIEIKGGKPDVASNYLAQVNLPQYEGLRDRLYRLMEQQRSGDEPTEREESGGKPASDVAAPAADPITEK